MGSLHFYLFSPTESVISISISQILNCIVSKHFDDPLAKKAFSLSQFYYGLFPFIFTVTHYLHFIFFRTLPSILYFSHFDSEDDYRTGCRNVSHCQQQSHSRLRSPGRSNSTYFWNDSWVQTFHSFTFFICWQNTVIWLLNHQWPYLLLTDSWATKNLRCFLSLGSENRNPSTNFSVSF